MSKQTFDLWERLNEFLEFKSWKIRDFSNATGISVQLLYRYKNRTGFPTVSNLLVFSDLLDCSIDYLLGVNETKKRFRNGKSVDFYSRVILLMKEKEGGVQQATLARECKFARSSFSNWKQGRIPRPRELMTIADYLNCSVEYLLGISDVR